ncbi:MAG: exodeoxyribonuclease III [Candidatus Diapherotrites archaeon]|nr:exodeoxyribonuclease III [Candidatus Diapherotrites archaeon]
MKIVTWNVNGLRAAYSKGFLKWMEKYSPDILCLQETKLQEEQIPKELKDHSEYYKYWGFAKKRGYSGTAVFTKEKPVNVSYKMDGGKFDDEGRIITLEFKNYFLVNIYAPHSRHDLSRLEFKVEFMDVLIKYLKSLEKKKPIILCGDYNIAHREIDLARPKDNVENPGFRPEERAKMDKLIDSGFVDTFRMFTKGNGHYTWWSYRMNARKRNIGWRIDYVLVSKKLSKNIKNAFILSDVMGSDHCPAGVEFK